MWLDSRLFPALGLSLGDTVSVGYAKLRVTRVLTAEPDRRPSFLDLGPRLLMRVEDVPATKLIQPGSRISYRLLLAGNPETLEDLKDSIEPDLRPNYRWRNVRESSRPIGGALERAESFLLLGGLLAVLLGGAAVALAAHRYARRHYSHVGVLKTLGATPQEILWSYVGVLLVIGVVGVLAGLVLGILVHLGIVATLSTYLPYACPGLDRTRSWSEASPVSCASRHSRCRRWLNLRRISPMRVIRREPERGLTDAITYGFAAIGSIGLLVWYTQNVWLTAWALTGAVLVCGAFALVALGLLRGGRMVGMQAGSAWRLALAGLQRRRRENVAQITIFGLGLMMLLILLLVRTALIAEWRAQIPPNAPNHFLINVAADEVGAVQDLLREHTDYDGRLYPMIRGRVVAVNGEPLRSWRRQNRERGEDMGPGLGSERNLTWSDTVPGDNALVQGEWWPADTTEALISVEVDYARGTGLGVGDTLDFDIGGIPVSARVSNLRRVEWDSMQPNFFIVFSRPALAEFATTHMTSFHLEPDRKPFLNRLLAAHPTITLFEVDGIIDQVERIIDRVTRAIELILALVLGAGALVLIASIQASHEMRMKEHALVRALGGTRRLISGALAGEFAVLGAFAGIVAVLGAEVTVFALQTWVFELEFEVHPWLWLAGPAVGILLIASVGWLGTRKLVRSPPLLVLREL